MCDISSESTIRALKEYISIWELRHQIVSDNGPAFASEQFQDFVLRNAKHTKTVPYHPASNGGRLRTPCALLLKKKFKVLLMDNTRQNALCKYLFYCRSTSHCTEKTPAELHLNRCLRTRLNVIKSDIRSRAEQKQLSTNCNVSDYEIAANGDISARRSGETTSTKPPGTISARTEGRRSSRVPKPRQILNS